MTIKDQRSKDLETLIILALGLSVLSRVFAAGALEAAAFLVLITAVMLPRPAARLAALWMSFGSFLGRINSRILLTIIFYLVLTPVAFLYRIFAGKDVLRLERDGTAGSLWNDCERTYGKADFEKGW